MRKLLLFLFFVTFSITGFAGNILIYGPRLAGAPNEQTLAIAAGHTVTVVTAAQWTAMTTTAQFAAYDAIIIPDNACGSTGGNNDFLVLNANKAIWSPAITGKRFYMGADGTLHRMGQYQQVMTNGINFVTNPGATGLYVNFSCSFAPSGVVSVDFLSLVDVITISGGCFDAATIQQPTHPTMTGINNAGLSNWGCTGHGRFNSFPPSLLDIADINGTSFILASAGCPPLAITCPSNIAVNNTPGSCGEIGRASCRERVFKDV